MFKNTWLYKYYEAIKFGEVVVGEEVKQQMRILINDLNEIEQGKSKFIYDTRKIDEIIDFIENVVPITKSQGYGNTMKLFLWQKAIIEAVYSFKYADDPDVDRFKRIVILVAKKNGKSGLCSALGLAELVLGDGGQMIFFASNDYKQASLIYDTLVDMAITIDPHKDVLRKNQSEIRNVSTLTRGRKMSNKSGNNDGHDIDTAFIDEYHEAPDDGIFKIIEMGMSAKESPKLWVVSTEGFNQDGALSELLKESRAILNGEDDTPLAERTLSFLYTQDSEDEITSGDESMWLKSNPALGETKMYEYMREKVEESKKSPSARAWIYTKDFNIPQSDSNAWLDLQDYTYITEDFELEQFRGRRCAVGVDLSRTTDLSSVTFLFVDDSGRKHAHVMTFMPQSKLERSPDFASGAKYKEWIDEGLIKISGNNEIDIEEIADYIIDVYNEYGIIPAMVGYDEKFSREFVNKIEMLVGKDGHQVIYPNANTLSTGIELLEMDLKARVLNYNNNEVMSWGLSNAALQLNKEGKGMIVKKGGIASNRIDMVDSLVISYTIFRNYKSDIIHKD